MAIFFKHPQSESISSYSPPCSPTALFKNQSQQQQVPVHWFPSSSVGLGVGGDTEEGFKIKQMSFSIIMDSSMSTTACFHYPGQGTSCTNCCSVLEWERYRSCFSLLSTSFSMSLSLFKMIISLKYHNSPQRTNFFKHLLHVRHYSGWSSFIILYYLFKNPVK